MNRKRPLFSRRNFLAGAGGAAVSLPLLNHFATPARAAGQGPERLVVFFHPQGMIMDAWRPIGTGSNFELSEILQPLGQLNPATGTPLKDDCVIISGLDNVVVQLNQLAGGHPSASRSLFSCQPLSGNVYPDGTLKPQAEQVMEGHAWGPSIDQVIADRIGADTQYKSVDLSVGSKGLANHNQTFYAGADDPVTPEDDIQSAFDRLFSDLDVQDPTTIQRLRSARGSVLDTVSESFTQLNGRVGAEDRQRLEAHADKIRELETRLGGGEPLPSCETPELTIPNGFDPQISDLDNLVAPIMIDLAVMALTCDLTRVATVQFSHFQTPQFPWLGYDIPGAWDDWHGMIHEGRETPSGRPAMVAVMQWYTEMFVYLLNAMASVPEGDGTMLDNSLVLWMSEFGDGQGHNSRNLPTILAGNLCGAVNTGQHLDHTGRTVGDLNTTLLNLFGFDDECFGFEGTCSGPLSGIAT